jgi:hypothetical protein
MTYEVKFLIYLMVLLFSGTIGFYRYKHLDFNSRIIFYLIILVIVGEIADYYFAFRFKNNMPVYHVFSVVHLIAVLFYFVSFLKINRYLYAGIVVLIIAAGIANARFLQPLNTLNSNFLLFENFSITVMSMYALYKILIDDNIIKVYKYIHFWLWVLLLVLYCSTFYLWSFYKILSASWSGWEYIRVSHWLINLLVYAGFGIVFLLLPKIDKKEIYYKT